MSSDDDDDANVMPIYDQKIFNYCGRIKNNSNEKTNDSINVHKMDEKNKYVTQKQTTTTKLQASDLGQTQIQNVMYTMECI